MAFGIIINEWNGIKQIIKLKRQKKTTILMWFLFWSSIAREFCYQETFELSPISTEIGRISLFKCGKSEVFKHQCCSKQYAIVDIVGALLIVENIINCIELQDILQMNKFINENCWMRYTQKTGDQVNVIRLKSILWYCA